MNNNNLDTFMEKVTDTLHRIDINMAKVQVDLSHHIRRSDNLETQVDLLQAEVNKQDRDLIRFKAWITMSGWIVATGIAVLEFFIK